jgi:hypothetical protein
MPKATQTVPLQFIGREHISSVFLRASSLHMKAISSSAKNSLLFGRKPSWKASGVRAMMLERIADVRYYVVCAYSNRAKPTLSE